MKAVAGLGKACRRFITFTILNMSKGARNMVDPIGLLSGSHKEAIIICAGFLVYILALSFFEYRHADSEDEKKTTLTFLGVFGSLALASLAITIYFDHIA